MMSTEPTQQALAKLQPLELPEVYARINLPEEAAAAVSSCTSVPEALAALEAEGFRLEAARLFAHTLPKREAVWWACMCARHTTPADLPETDREAPDSAEVSVRGQTAELRRTAIDNVPHVGGPIVAPGAPTVLIGGLPAARMTDMVVCVGPPDVVLAPCAPTVLIGGLPAARLTDMTAHGGVIVGPGAPTVLIG